MSRKKAKQTINWKLVILATLLISVSAVITYSAQMLTSTSTTTSSYADELDGQSCAGVTINGCTRTTKTGASYCQDRNHFNTFSFSCEPLSCQYAQATNCVAQLEEGPGMCLSLEEIQKYAQFLCYDNPDLKDRCNEKSKLIIISKDDYRRYASSQSPTIMPRNRFVGVGGPNESCTPEKDNMPLPNQGEPAVMNP